MTVIEWIFANAQSGDWLRGTDDCWVIDREKLNELRCPQCRHNFILRWNNYSYGNKIQTLFIRDCPSGGVYDVYIECPNCDYHEDL